MKTVLLSTSGRALPIAKALHQCSNLDLCVTKEDVLVGREQKIKENELKVFSSNNGISLLQIGSLSKEVSDTLLHTLERVNPDIIIIVDFAFIIKSDLVSTFNGKLINIHFSTLPKYRGSSPAQFVILNGEGKTGITYQLVGNGMDTGDILKTVAYPTTGKETSGELYKELFELAAKDLPVFLEQFENKTLTARSQNETEASYTYSPTHPKSTYIYKEDAYTDLKEDAILLERKVRAYTPWPNLYSTLANLEKTQGIQLIPTVNKDLKVKILKAKGVENKFIIENLQIEGKKVIDWNTFTNGYTKH